MAAPSRKLLLIGDHDGAVCAGVGAANSRISTPSPRPALARRALRKRGTVSENHAISLPSLLRMASPSFLRLRVSRRNTGSGELWQNLEHPRQVGSEQGHHRQLLTAEEGRRLWQGPGSIGSSTNSQWAVACWVYWNWKR